MNPAAAGGRGFPPDTLQLHFRDTNQRRMRWKSGRRLRTWVKDLKQASDQAWFVMDKWDSKNKAFVRTGAGYCVQLAAIRAVEDYDLAQEAAPPVPAGSGPLGFRIRTRTAKTDGWVFASNSMEEKAQWVEWMQRIFKGTTLYARLAEGPEGGPRNLLLDGGAGRSPTFEVQRGNSHETATPPPGRGSTGAPPAETEWAGDTHADDDDYAVTDKMLGLMAGGMVTDVHWQAVLPDEAVQVQLKREFRARPFEPQLADTTDGVRYDQDGVARPYPAFAARYGRVQGSLIWQHSLVAPDEAGDLAGTPPRGAPPDLLPELRPPPPSRWGRREERHLEEGSRGSQGPSSHPSQQSARAYEQGSHRR